MLTRGLVRTALAGLAFLASAHQGPVPAAGAPAREDSRPRHFRVAAASYRPFAFRTDGVNRGLDFDVLNVVCSARGWTYDVEWMSFQQMLASLQDGTADLAVGAIYVSPERSKTFDFTIPYLRTGLVIVTQSTARVTSVRDLDGLRVGVKSGATGERVARQLLQAGRRFEVVPFESTEASFAALHEAQVDAVLNDYLNSVANIAARYPGELMVSEDFWGPIYLSHDRLAFPMRRGLDAERKAFDETLRQMEKGGVLAQICETWLPYRSRLEPRSVIFWSAGLILAIAGAVALFLAVARQRARSRLLRESERRTRSLVDDSPVAIVVHRAGTILYGNKAALNLYGLTSLAQLVGHPVTEFVAPAEQPRVAAVVEARATGRDAPGTYVSKGLRADGAEFAVGVRVAEVELADGKAFLSYLEDVTERQRMLDTLARSERDYRGLFEGARDAILILDLNNLEVLEANRRACDLYDFERDDLVGRRLSELVVDSVPMEERRRSFTGRGDQALEFETTHRRRDGSTIQFEVRASRIEYGGRPAVLSVHHDITARRRAEDALRRSEENYRLLVENQNDLVVKVDREDRFLFVSPSYCETFGKSQGDLLGRSFLPLVHEEDREPTLRAMEALYRPPHTAYMEQRAMTRDGWRWFAWSDRAVLDDDGEVAAVIGVGRDITERKVAERALQESEERFRTLTETTSAGILIYQGESIRYANSAMCDITGFSMPELLEKKFWQLVHPEFQGLVRDRGLARQREATVPEHYELKILARQGEERWVDFRAGLTLFEGRPAGIVTAFDITERRRAEEAVRESERRLRLVFENVQEIIYYNALAGEPPELEPVFVSPQLKNILGYSPDSFLGRPEAWFEAIHPEDRDKMMAAVPRMLATGRADTFQYRFRHGVTGEYHWVEDKVVPQIGDRGQVVGFFGVARDVTERNRAEERIRRSASELEAIFQALPDLYFKTDLSGRVLDFRAGQESDYFAAAAAVPGRLLSEILPAEAAAVLLDGTVRCHERRTQVTVEFGLPAPQGERTYEARIIPLMEDQVVSVVRNVTAQRSAIFEVLESERKFRALFENASDAIFVMDEEAIVDLNPKTTEVFGCGRDDMLGQHPLDFSPRTQPDGQDSRALLRRRVHKAMSGEPQFFEWSHIKMDGAPFDAEVTLSPLPMHGENMVLAIVRDVTERKRAADQARRLNQELMAVLSSSQAMAGFLELKSAAKAICDSALAAFDARMAWIGLVVPEDTEVRILASAGHDEGYTDQVRVRWDLSDRAMGPTGRSIKERRPVVMATGDPAFMPWRDEAEKRGYRVCCGVPLIHEDAVRGALNLYSSDPEAFSPDSLGIIEIFARQATMAIVNASLYEEARWTIQELMALNERLVAAEEALGKRLADLETSQRALAESEERFRQLAESSGSAIFILKENRFRYVNPLMETLSGYPARELLEMAASDLARPDFRDELAEGLSTEDGELAPGRREICIVTKDGQNRWVDLATGLFEFQGQPAVIGTAFDVTERREAEEALLQSETRYRDLIENTSDWIWEVDDRMRYVYASPKVEELLGYVPSEVLGKTPVEFMPPAEAARLGPELMGLLEEPRPFRALENVSVAKDGSLRTLETSGVPVYDADGRLKGYRGIDRDVTERARLYADIADWRRRYEVVSVASGQVIYEYNSETGAVLWSDGLREVLGCAPEDLGDVRAWAEHIHPDDLDEATRQAKDAERTLGSFNMVYRFRHRDGRYLTVRDRGFYIPPGAGKPCRMVGMIADISEATRTMQALRQSEEEFRRTFDLSPVGAVMVGLDHRFIRCNEAYCRFLGHAEEELAGKTFLDFTHPEDRGIGMDQLERLLSGEIDVAHMQKRYLRKDGSVAWGELTVRLVPDAEGRPHHHLTIVQDITARRQAEEAHRQSERTLSSIFQIAPTGICLTDEEGRYVRANDVYCRIFDFPREELLGRRFTDLMPEDEVAEAEKRYAAVLAGGVPPLTERRRRRKDGTVIAAQIASALLVGEAGRKLVVTVVSDVTERRRAAEALRQSEECYRIVTEQTGQLVYDYDLLTGRLRWGGAVEAVTGYTPDEFTASITEWEAMIHPEDRAETLRVMAKVREAAGPYGVTYRFRKKDGSYILVEERGVSLADDSGRACRHLGTMADVTFRHLAQRTLRQTGEALARFMLTSRLPAIAIDRSTTVLEWNGAAETLAGWKAREARGRPCPMLTERSRPLLMEFMARVDESGHASLDMKGCPRKDGSTHDLRITGFPMRDEDARMTGLLMFLEQVGSAEATPPPPGTRKPARRKGG